MIHKEKIHPAIAGFIIVILLIPAVLTAAKTNTAPGKAQYHVKPTSGKIKIDGIPSEKAWNDAVSIDLKYENYPGENLPAPVKTTCKITYDNKNLYVAFIALDPEPSRLRARFTRRDDIFQQDRVAIILDTFNDKNRAFGFDVNPLGVQQDCIYINGGAQWDFSWDAIWYSAGKINKNGYTVEMAIPFRSLQFYPGEQEQVWGFEPLRYYMKDKFSWMSCYKTDYNESCTLCQYPTLTGIKARTRSNNIELDPTITWLNTAIHDDHRTGTLQFSDSRFDAGISGHWGFSSNMTLSAAVNPDFSHVEADSAQLDINTQFALYYEEKRPFFLEGLDFFSSPLEAVYTRTVADPQWGIKLSGKTGPSGIGFFSARDSITNLLFPGSEGSTGTSLDTESQSGVLRWRRDIGKSSSLGVLITDREARDYHNRVAGFDGLIRLSKSNTLTFQFLGSHTAYPDEIAEEFGQKKQGFTGTAMNLVFQKQKRTYFWQAGFKNFTPGFRADLGFIPRVDFREFHAEGGYIRKGKSGDFLSLFQAAANLSWLGDHGGNLINKEAGINISAEGPLHTNLQGNLRTARQVFNGQPFDLIHGDLFLSIRPSGKFYMSLYCSAGDDIDYAHTRKAASLYLRPTITLNWGKHFNLTLNHSVHRLNIQTGRLFTANLSQLNLVYYFNRRAFLRGILQYTHIKRDPLLYRFNVDPLYKKLYTQFLFSFLINPRTVLFLGYTDNHHGFDRVPIYQTDRTFFIKVGYALAL